MQRMPRSVPDTGGRESRGRIMLVDDEFALVGVEARQLMALGFHAQAFASARHALAQLRLEKFDAIVTDIHMPDMDGLRFFRELRRYDPDVPVLLRSGQPTIETAAQAVDLGAFKYLIKPVEFEELTEHLARAVQLHRLGRAKRDALTELGNHSGEGGDKFALEASFERALDGLWMAFQPIIRSDGVLFGYEALLRSNEPSLPHPGAVLDAAERLRRIPDLGRTIRQRALSELTDEQEWSLFLNLHPSDLLDPNLLESLMLRPALLPRIVLEITERASLETIPDARERIACLRRAGCRIAVDDLGAGYAGLSSFVQLEPDIVKLDISLVRDADKSDVKRRLIRALTSVCQDMGLSIVAEGIETEAERDVLVGLGCDLLQGYQFGRPARPFVLPTW